MKHIKATWSNTKHSNGNDYNDHLAKQIIIWTYNQKSTYACPAHKHNAMRTTKQRYQ